VKLVELSDDDLTYIEIAIGSLLRDPETRANRWDVGDLEELRLRIHREKTRAYNSHECARCNPSMARQNG